MIDQYAIYNTVEPIKILSFYIFVIISFLFMVYKYRNDSVFILVILCFYSGLAAYLGKNVENPYKILLVILSIYLLLKYKVFHHTSKKVKLTIFSFILFSSSFFISAFLNKDYIYLTFSQYGKYIVPFILFLIFVKYGKYTPAKLIKLQQLLFTLMIIQVLLSVIKLLIIGVQESIVGTISFIGGGVATTLPILGFIILWLMRNEKLSKKDWLFVVLLLSIGFVSNKRAIWFAAPTMIFLFMIYIPGKLTLRRIPVFLGLALLIFYIGVRLNPTLNKENKFWGDFDLDYVITYTQEYTFGINTGIEHGVGRGGTALLFYNNLIKGGTFSLNNFFGFGLDKIYTKDYSEFDQFDFGISSKGAATGIFQSYITAGFIGIFATLLYAISLLLCINNNKIKYVMIGFFLWDYILYSGLILRVQALTILVLFIIVYLMEGNKYNLKSFLHSKYHQSIKYIYQHR